VTKIITPRRRASGAKRLDGAVVREAVRRLLPTNGMTIMTGLVFVPDGASSHFKLESRGGKISDVLVEVETVGAQRQDLTCRLATLVGGPGCGLWRVPPVGAEVVVALPDGQPDHMPTIIGVLSTGETPKRVSPERTVLVATDAVEIIAPAVFLGEGEDGATHPVGRGDKLEAKLNSLIGKYNVHTHAVPGPATSGSPSTTETTLDDGQSPTVKVT
jgi:hypothetical protein